MEPLNGHPLTNFSLSSQVTTKNIETTKTEPLLERFDSQRLKATFGVSHLDTNNVKKRLREENIEKEVKLTRKLLQQSKSGQSPLQGSYRDRILNN